MYSNILNRDVWMLSSYKKGDIDYLDVELEMSIIELVNVIGISLKNDVGLPSTNVSNSLALAFSSIPELYSTESIKNKGRDVEGIKYLIEKQRSSD